MPLEASILRAFAPLLERLALHPPRKCACGVAVEPMLGEMDRCSGKPDAAVFECPGCGTTRFEPLKPAPAGGV